MQKEAKKKIIKSFIVVLFILLLNLTFFLYQGNFDFSSALDNPLTGNSIMEIPAMISKTYSELSTNAKIFLLIEWVLLLTFLGFAYFKNRKVLHVIKITKEELRKASINGNTDLDTLYNLLQTKEKIKLSQIEQAFKIKKELALEWAQILESNNMAVIDYPSFLGEAVIKSMKAEKEEKIEDEKKDKEKEAKKKEEEQKKIKGKEEKEKKRK